jgi:hypothetical protein
MLFMSMSRSRGFHGNLRGPRSAPIRQSRSTNSSGEIMTTSSVAASSRAFAGRQAPESDTAIDVDWPARAAWRLTLYSLLDLSSEPRRL